MKTLMIMVVALVIVSIMYIKFMKRSDYKIWNDGKCKCGGTWKFTGMTVAGSRMYICDYCQREIIITDSNI